MTFGNNFPPESNSEMGWFVENNNKYEVKLSFRIHFRVLGYLVERPRRVETRLLPYEMPLYGKWVFQVPFLPLGSLALIPGCVFAVV